MFSGKVFFAASLALSSMVGTVSADATAKADCWSAPNCPDQPGDNAVLTNGDGVCLLPLSNSGLYPLPDDGTYPIAYLMGSSFCGNRKSKNPDLAAARLEAITFCFGIGAQSACIWGECGQPDSCFNQPPITFGDPHFKTWTGEMYDYHGVCDLVFLESKSHNVKIHIRTTQRFHYSYVSSAVLEINGEKLEVGGYGSVIANDVYEPDADELPETVGGRPLSMIVSNKKTHSFTVMLEDGSGIELKSFKEMVGIKLLGTQGHWADSVGLMGNASTGAKLARDGATVIEDANAFGQEWQVAAGEQMLFNTVREPQAPNKCMVPDLDAKYTRNGRRLGETMARADAEAACKNWHMNKEACISDVMASGDAELAANVY